MNDVNAAGQWLRSAGRLCGVVCCRCTADKQNICGWERFRAAVFRNSRISRGVKIAILTQRNDVHEFEPLPRWTVYRYYCRPPNTSTKRIEVRFVSPNFGRLTGSVVFATRVPRLSFPPFRRPLFFISDRCFAEIEAAEHTYASSLPMPDEYSRRKSRNNRKSQGSRWDICRFSTIHSIGTLPFRYWWYQLMSSEVQETGKYFPFWSSINGDSAPDLWPNSVSVVWWSLLCQILERSGREKRVKFWQHRLGVAYMQPFWQLEHVLGLASGVGGFVVFRQIVHVWARFRCGFTSADVRSVAGVTWCPICVIFDRNPTMFSERKHWPHSKWRRL